MFAEIGHVQRAIESASTADEATSTAQTEAQNVKCRTFTSIDSKLDTILEYMSSQP